MWMCSPLLHFICVVPLVNSAGGQRSDRVWMFLNQLSYRPKHLCVLLPSSKLLSFSIAGYHYTFLWCLFLLLFSLYRWQLCDFVAGVNCLSDWSGIISLFSVLSCFPHSHSVIVPKQVAFLLTVYMAAAFCASQNFTVFTMATHL